MIKHGLLTGASNARFISEQGTKMGRRSLLHVRIVGNKQGEEIYVGGHVTAIAEGRMRL
jgi:trans-2,3-dihydro-3-hydroxyanthranilate isomerase